MSANVNCRSSSFPYTETSLYTQTTAGQYYEEDEEEDEEESDDEGQELSLPADGGILGDESLEPPAKLARTDQRVLFATGSADN
uniref:RFX1 transcription activation region domain-containing protein n=1 Tax=Knipowitschia caucasica TaxID=637954 RepID=A0AAV2KFV4_KNICA